MTQSAAERERDFTKLYSESFDYIYAFLLSRTAGDKRLTEEIAQDTFAAAWLSFDRFQRESSFQTWVCAIARNKLNESYRKAIRREKREFVFKEEPVERADGFDLEEAVLSRETGREVLRALQSLSPSYRYALILKYVDGFSVKEIAGVMGRTAKAVDGVLQRAKAAFERAYLQAER
jgi:RNA polymerase sigma-70 factor (ECF subfamily)